VRLAVAPRQRRNEGWGSVTSDRRPRPALAPEAGHERSPRQGQPPARGRNRQRRLAGTRHPRTGSVLPHVVTVPPFVPGAQRTRYCTIRRSRQSSCPRDGKDMHTKLGRWLVCPGSSVWSEAFITLPASRGPRLNAARRPAKPDAIVETIAKRNRGSSRLERPARPRSRTPTRATSSSAPRPA
jgi:hypothetical protein